MTLVSWFFLSTCWMLLSLVEQDQIWARFRSVNNLRLVQQWKLNLHTWVWKHVKGWSPPGPHLERSSSCSYSTSTSSSQFRGTSTDLTKGQGTGKVCYFAITTRDGYIEAFLHKYFTISKRLERFHMTSRRPYWCSKTMKCPPCWCFKKILWELNSFLV